MPIAELLGFAAQYGIAVVAVVACAFALWFMYKLQLGERQRILDSHEKERQSDRTQFQFERGQLMEIISKQHGEAMDVQRRNTEVLVELTTFIKAKLN